MSKQCQSGRILEGVLCAGRWSVVPREGGAATHVADGEQQALWTATILGREGEDLEHKRAHPRPRRAHTGHMSHLAFRG